ncbi:MAG: heme o synthase [Chloroflexota bacterium]
MRVTAVQKFSLSAHFTRLTMLTMLATLLVTVGGRYTKITGALAACAGWPLCWPTHPIGWIGLGHRLAVGLASVLMVWLLFTAWRRHREERVLLPLTTVIVVLYFGEALIGAVQASTGFALHLILLHGLTAISLWIGLAALALVSGFLSPAPMDYPRVGFVQRFKDFLTLTKPIVVLLLLATTFASLLAGLRGWPSFSLAFFTLLGGALAAGGSSALNQFIDRDLDKNMQRTEKRPLAAGRMFPAEGLAFSLALCLLSYYILACYVNVTAALLSLAGIFYYAVIYSIWLKKATTQNIVIGGGAGAIPPMVGWAAATGRIDLVSIILFAIVFFWTPPHFWALAIVRQQDYARAGVPMLPVVRGEQETRKQIWIYTWVLVAVTLLLPIFNLAGTIYLVSAMVLGLWLIYGAWRVWKQEGNKVAWQMYRWTSMYLLFLFIAFTADAMM